MSQSIFVVSVPLVVVRNYVVAAESADEACAVVKRVPGDWLERCMHNERVVGFYETFDGVPLKATPITDVLKQEDGEVKEVLS